MFIRLYWWLFQIKYCNGCHAMTSQYKDILGAVTCKKCKTSNCTRNYKELIHRLLDHKITYHKDPYTRKFLIFVLGHYYKSGNIIIEYDTHKLIEYEYDIYIEFLYKTIDRRNARINNTTQG